MATTKTRIHIICGICGSDEHMNYKVNHDANIFNKAEENEYRKDAVVISCDNCGSITYLDEVMKENE